MQSGRPLLNGFRDKTVRAVMANPLKIFAFDRTIIAALAAPTLRDARRKAVREERRAQIQRTLEASRATLEVIERAGD